MRKRKERQANKIKEILDTLNDLVLDEKAAVLGLSRSTTYHLSKGEHKGYGLQAGTIRKMLSCPRLPVATRIKILEYVEERGAGFYGDYEHHLEIYVKKIAK